MFKNMKLSAKISIGFGIVIIIAAALGISGWYGLNKVKAITSLNDQGNIVLSALNSCATARRDFTINGFTDLGGNVTAYDKWEESFNTFKSDLESFESMKGLSKSNKSTIHSMLTQLEPYKNLFEQNANAQKDKDKAFKSWGTIGWDVTSKINNAIENVINPAKNEALKNADIQALNQWSAIGDSLSENIIQNFLVLRITAVYLIATEADAQWNGYQQQLAKTREGIDTWKSTVKDKSQLVEAANTITSLIDQYEQAGNSFHNGVTTQRKTDTEMASVASSLVSNMNDLKKILDSEMTATISKTTYFLVAMITSGVVVGVCLAFVITLSIVKPINRIILNLTEGAEQVTSAAGQVSAASQSLAEGATEQAAGLEETSSSLEEMASMTRQNADNAQQANTLSEEAKKAADSGTEAMGKMDKAINDIQKSSDETAKIIKVIDEIAFQTNLLALNAAVEAARAGEAGKGFAVVAEEVRNLAMRSAEAAKNTSEMIEESVKNAKNGVDIASEVGQTLTSIVESIGKTSGLVNEIAAASQEQAQGIDQVNIAVSQMDKVTQSNAANAEESASASEELSAQSEQMMTVVDELTSLIRGSSERSHGMPKKKHSNKLSTGNKVFHQIADGKSSVNTSAKNSIPLTEDEVIDEFNK